MQHIDKQYAVAFVRGIKKTLTGLSVDYDKVIDSYGQVAACIRRDAGYSFKLKEHIRGLILAQLSNQRSWQLVAHNIHKIDRIFFQFDSEKEGRSSITK